MTASAESLADVDVVVLAGGLGTRLRGALGNDLPKVLAPIGGRPFLDLLIDWLAGYGVRRLVLCLGHLADKVEAHLSRRTTLAAVDIETVVEPEPLGTGGALRFAASRLTSDPVLALNGDTWTDTDLTAFATAHRAHDAYLTILCAEVSDASRYGRLEVDEDDRVMHYAEKEDVPRRGLISAGFYLLSRRALEDLVASGAASFERDFLQRQPPGRIRAHFAGDARFIDIGTPESLSQAPDVILRENGKG